jgi:hypothetical protein
MLGFASHWHQRGSTKEEGHGLKERNERSTRTERITTDYYSPYENATDNDVGVGVLQIG